MALQDALLPEFDQDRAQLGVPLRLNHVPVPAVYGPSADEGSF